MPSRQPTHDAHLALSELVLILPRDEGHDHVLDESNLHLSKLRSTVYCAATHLDRSCVHLCDNELHLLCAALQFAELLGDRHHGTNGRYLDDHDLLVDGHYLDDRDLPADDLLNHHDHTTDDHRDLRDLLVDDRDLDHHFAHMQDGLLDDYPDGMGVRHDLLTDGHYLDGRDCPKDDPDLRLVCLNDHQRHQGVRDAKVCQILLPVADDVDRDFQGLALNEVYLQTTPKRRRLTECD